MVDSDQALEPIPPHYVHADHLQRRIHARWPTGRSIQQHPLDCVSQDLQIPKWSVYSARYPPRECSPHHPFPAKLREPCIQGRRQAESERRLREHSLIHTPRPQPYHSRFSPSEMQAASILRKNHQDYRSPKRSDQLLRC